MADIGVRDGFDLLDDVDEPANEVTWALGRRADCTYVHRSFALNLRASQDFGLPARYVVKVFDDPGEAETQPSPLDSLERTEAVVYTTPGGRKQIKLQVVREAGRVRQIQIQRVPTRPDATKLENILTLDREASRRLIELIQVLQHIPVEGEDSVRLDDQTIRALFADPAVMRDLYSRDPGTFRQLIENDGTADDLVAVEHRKQVAQRFRQLLENPETFEEAKASHNGRPEQVWQDLFEENPWILGIGLTGQLLTSWNEDRLEQVVAGASVAGVGKRTDALLRTNGRMRSMVFAEIKHHQTPLLAAKEYRSGCWAPSAELSGGITQVQQTVHIATQQIRGRLPDVDDGVETGEATYLVRPRSFLIVGHLEQPRGRSGGVHQAKYQSFELHRRNLYEPEVITFDELLARAEWNTTPGVRQTSMPEETQRG